MIRWQRRRPRRWPLNPWDTALAAVTLYAAAWTALDLLTKGPHA